jgi:hypothetical protein
MRFLAISVLLLSCACDGDAKMKIQGDGVKLDGKPVDAVEIQRNKAGDVTVNGAKVEDVDVKATMNSVDVKTAPAAGDAGR